MKDKYLYFTHQDDLPKIMISGQINNRKSKHRNSSGEVLNSKNQLIIAFVYHIPMISESQCYITYPLDFLGTKPVTVWKRLFGIIPFPATVKSFQIPPMLRAISFEISNEKDLEHWYLSDIMLPKRLYCESVSAKPLVIKSIKEIAIQNALEIIGLHPPYIHYGHHYYLKNKILISQNYKITW